VSRPDNVSPATMTSGSPFDVVALVTSAGGLSALNQLLRVLPDDFDAALVVVQHLGGQRSYLAEILHRRSPLPVHWIADHDLLKRGQVYVCPPQHLLEIMPDAECLIRPMEPDHRLRPIDFFLSSLAGSYGRRAVVAVLTGMGNDAAAGSQAVSQAGGTVLVQSPESAGHPSMPSGVIDTGTAHMILPLPELGRVLADVVAGGTLPRPLSERAAADTLFAGGGEVPAMLREMNWTRTTFGPVGEWPAALRTVIRVVLDSPLAMCLFWGPDQVQLYNDPYRMMMGSGHPAGLGQPGRPSLPDAWHLNEPIFARAGRGEPVAVHDALLPFTKHGILENAWFDLNYLPVRDDDGRVAGTLCLMVETTADVLSRRRLDTLSALSTATSGSATRESAFGQTLSVLAASSQDVPFAVGYHLDGQEGQAHLAGAAGVQPGSPMAPDVIGLTSARSWPLRRVVTRGEPLVIDQVAALFPGVPARPGGRPASSALLLPLRDSGGDRVTGVLVLGVSPLLPLDAGYRAFLLLVAAQIEAALAAAQSRHREHRRLRQLAELDRAKTEF
jgi:CheB methylesterase/GAF domain-containing protein